MNPPSLAPSRALSGSILSHRLPFGLSALLLLNVVVWAWFGFASRSNLDGPGDMVETFVWGQAWQWGYFKHPPLMAWLAGAWFHIFPTRDPGFALLAACNASLGLAGFAVLSREVLPRPWQGPALVAALLLPSSTLMAMRFNANAVLLATWPWVTAFFLRYMARGQWRDGVGFAVAATLAMLGKYFSAVLLLALLLGALTHAPWRSRLLTARSAACVALLLGLLAPHVIWTLQQEVGPLNYAAAAAQVAGGDGQLARRVLSFAAGIAALAAPGALLLLWLGRRTGPSRWQALLDLVRPGSDPLWWPLVGSVVLTVGITMATGARTSTVWGLPMPLGLLLFVAHRLQRHGAPAQPQGDGLRALWTFWALVALAAPLGWRVLAHQPSSPAGEPRAELAALVAEVWDERYGTDLPWVSGSEALAASVSFYTAGKARYWSLQDTAHRSPWVDARQLRLDGSVIVCHPDDAPCATAAQRATGSAPERLHVAKRARGVNFKPQAFDVYFLAPIEAAWMLALQP